MNAKATELWLHGESPGGKGGFALQKELKRSGTDRRA